MAKPETANTLFYGDNLPILREHIDSESIVVKMPPAYGTFKQAPKAKGKDAEQKELGL